jgi:hypothetical protein
VGGTAPYEVMWNNNITTEDQVNVLGGNYFAIVTDANGCQTNANATIDAYTPIDTTGQEGENVALVIEEELNFVVFPNPTNDNATVQWKGTAQELKLFNATGQLLENKNVENTNSFKFQNLSNGIFYIQLVINNTHKNIKLVVQ